jgi:Tfp pilus assembly protein PilF
MPQGRIEQLERLLASRADSALVRFSLGAEYLAKKQYAPAAEHLGRAVALDPTYTAAWKLYGKALTATGAVAEASAAFQRGLDAAEARGDIQAAREMRVFLKRLAQSRP